MAVTLRVAWAWVWVWVWVWVWAHHLQVGVNANPLPSAHQVWHKQRTPLYKGLLSFTPSTQLRGSPGSK